MSKDVVVLGAGIVGISVATHLRWRGWDVVVVARQGPGDEASFGNAGLIQREAVYPHGFPRAIKNWRGLRATCPSMRSTTRWTCRDSRHRRSAGRRFNIRANASSTN